MFSWVEKLKNQYHKPYHETVCIESVCSKKLFSVIELTYFFLQRLHFHINLPLCCADACPIITR